MTFLSLPQTAMTMIHDEYFLCRVKWSTFMTIRTSIVSSENTERSLVRFFSFSLLINFCISLSCIASSEPNFPSNLSEMLKHFADYTNWIYAIEC